MDDLYRISKNHSTSEPSGFVPGRKNNHLPVFGIWIIGKLNISGLAQQLLAAELLTDNVCTPSPPEEFFLSLSPWLARKRNS